MKKRILSFVLILSIISSLIAALPVTANAATGGECGSDLTWEYADGTLTIDGRGDMFSYFFF